MSQIDIKEHKVRNKGVKMKIVEKIDRYLNKDIINVIYGRTKKGMPIIDKLLSLLYKNVEGGPIYNREFIEKQLKGLGLNDKEIDTIRKITQDAFKEALSKIVKKYNIEDEYISKGSNKDSFVKYQLFLNIDRNIRKELYRDAEKILKSKLK